MKTLTIFLTALMTFTACTKNSISGSGNTITETRNVSNFTGVQLEGSGKVNIVQGPQQKVEVTGYQNLLPIYETSVQNGTLVLKFKNEYYNIHNNNITVNIVAPSLSQTGTNGSGVYTVNNFTGSAITSYINGSGEVNFNSCVYQKAFVKVNGSGYVKAAHLQTVETDAEVNGSGKIDIACSQTLKATIHGSGEINYWGNPGVTASVSGSGSVKKR